MEPKRACCYVRVSTTDKQTTSRQVTDLIEFAKSQGYVITNDDVYSEHISGFTKGANRTVFSKLMEDLISGLRTYKKIFVTEVSRIARNPIEGRRIVDNLTEMGIAVHVQNNNICSLNDDGSQNFIFPLIYNVLLEFARTEAEYIKSRSISGIREKVRKGHAGSGIMLPYGYKRDDDKMLVIDGEESFVIKDIFSYVLEGFGTKQIAHILNSREIPTRTQKAIKKGHLKMKNSKMFKAVDDIEWVDAVIYGILKNPLYKGERRFKGEIISAPAIIESHVWNDVQEILATRSTEAARNTRYLYLLKGKLKCGRCGRNYVAKYRPGGKDAHYECSSRRKKCCGNTAVGIQPIESVVWDVLKNSPYVFDYLKSTGIEIKKAQQEIGAAKLQREIELKNLTDKESEKEQLVKLFQKKMITEARLDAEFATIEKSIEGISKRLDKLEKSIEAMAKLQQRLTKMDSFVNLLKSLEHDRFQIGNVLNSLLEKVIITAGEREGNQRRYLVDIFLKDVASSFTVMIVTNQSNQKADGSFILPEIVEKVGHNRVKYTYGGDEGLNLTYEGDILQSSVIDAFDKIRETMQTVFPSKYQQVNVGEFFIIRLDETITEFTAVEFVEIIPTLLPLEQSQMNIVLNTLATENKIRTIDKEQVFN